MTETARAWLEQRANSYSLDARTFRDAKASGKPVTGEDERWAAVYAQMAAELRKCAGELPAVSPS